MDELRIPGPDLGPDTGGNRDDGAIQESADRGLAIGFHPVVTEEVAVLLYQAVARQRDGVIVAADSADPGVGPQHGDGPGYRVGVERDVGVEEEQDLTARVRYPKISRGAHPGVGRRADDPDAEGLGDLYGVVGAAVVHEDYLDWPVGLRLHRPQAQAENAAIVVVGDDDGDERCGDHGLPPFLEIGRTGMGGRVPAWAERGIDRYAHESHGGARHQGRM